MLYGYVCGTLLTINNVICMVTDDGPFKPYVIKALTDIKYKLNIIIANQNDERHVCATCKKNQADEKSEEEENQFVSMFPLKNDGELLILERFLIDERNHEKLVSY